MPKENTWMSYPNTGKIKMRQTLSLLIKHSNVFLKITTSKSNVLHFQCTFLYVTKDFSGKCTNFLQTDQIEKIMNLPSGSVFMHSITLWAILEKEFSEKENFVWKSASQHEKIFSRQYLAMHCQCTVKYTVLCSHVNLQLTVLWTFSVTAMQCVFSFCFSSTLSYRAHSHLP